MFGWLITLSKLSCSLFSPFLRIADLFLSVPFNLLTALNALLGPAFFLGTGWAERKEVSCHYQYFPLGGAAQPRRE